jgi:hypothetical protein
MTALVVLNDLGLFGSLLKVEDDPSNGSRRAANSSADRIFNIFSPYFLCFQPCADAP